MPLVKVAEPTFKADVVLSEPEPLVESVKFSPLGTVWSARELLAALLKVSD